MAHTHHHHHHNHGEIKGKNLIITMLLNFSITTAEIIGGIFSGSLSLISDALHNLSDGISVIITYIALKLAQKKNTEKMTFGYKRAEIFAALFNSSVLIVVSVYLFKEAYLKFINPEPIKGGIMIAIALIGLFANTFSVFLLRKNAKDNVNIKSTYLHLLSDALSSIGVVIGGIMIYFYNINWIDPVLTVIIGIYVLKESLEILSDTIKILMQKAPDHIDVYEIKKDIENLDKVENIHHLHIWQVNEHDIHIEFHVKVKEDIKLSAADSIRDRINKLLHDKFEINHSIIQIEFIQKDETTLIKV
ncbi:cation diffusion facilitator family transporter [Marinitoga lauensis]|uniref:cation diffusion facilitator family transporter n=1 Tax=Marinitoga lauensis TaxID=2201189 RepID=UPI0010132E5D|nr:cation diffusion facilitator family transporter [Marinitoga lauensis]